MVGCVCVVQCVQVVFMLLQVFFLVVIQVVDGFLINQLVLLFLGRSDLFYLVLGYVVGVYSVLSFQFLVLCMLKFFLVVELVRDLLEFLGSVNGFCSRVSFVISVVWVIGEYLLVIYDWRCIVEQINKFFEVLEVLLFEVIQCCFFVVLFRCFFQVVIVLMIMLMKLVFWS